SRFDAVTMDSFAWRLERRWRALARSRCGDSVTGTFAETCDRAGKLLEDAVVARWVARTYPVVVVDEMQDCRGGQLAILQGLARHATCLAAADEFQDLDG